MSSFSPLDAAILLVLLSNLAVLTLDPWHSILGALKGPFPTIESPGFLFLVVERRVADSQAGGRRWAGGELHAFILPSRSPSSPSNPSRVLRISGGREAAKAGSRLEVAHVRDG